jgi:hypothetical protein
MSELQFTRVETGDMSEIPPDAPEGQWVASFKVKVASTSKDKFPMLIVDAKLDEALTEGNENFVGSKVSEFLVFFPQTHNASKMSRIRLKAFCEGLKIDAPRLTAIEKASDFDAFINDIESNRGVVWTKHEKDKETGEIRTKLLFTAPRGTVSTLPLGDDNGHDASEEKPRKRAAGRR